MSPDPPPGKKLVPVDSAALEEREGDLAMLAEGWEATTPVWLVASAHAARPRFWLGLLALQTAPLLLSGVLPEAVAALWMLAAPTFAMMVPEACEAALVGEARRHHAPLSVRWLRLGVVALLRVVLGYFRVYLTFLVSTLVVVLGVAATCAWLATLLPSHAVMATGMGLSLIGAAAVVRLTLTRALLPTILSLPAHALGVPPRAAFQRGRQLAQRDPGPLIAFGAATGAAGLAWMLMTSVLTGTFGPVLGVPFFFLGLNGFMALWTYRYLHELHGLQAEALPEPEQEGPRSLSAAPTEG